MDGALKALIGAACIAVIAASGAMADGLNPSAEKIDRCQKDYRFLMSGEAAKPLPEVGMKYFAIQFADCEEFGIFSSRQIRNILDSQVGEAFAAYKANPDIWRTAN